MSQEKQKLGSRKEDHREKLPMVPFSPKLHLYKTHSLIRTKTVTVKKNQILFYIYGLLEIRLQL